MIAPAATLATVLLVVWLGTSNFSGEEDEMGNRSAVATAPAHSQPSKTRRTPRTNHMRVQPVVPPSDFPAPPEVAVAPPELDSMTRSLHDRSISSQRAVTGAPVASYSRGSMAVLTQ